jgi:hypothetical protein
MDLRAALLDLLPGGEEKFQVVIRVLLPVLPKHGSGDGGLGVCVVLLQAGRQHA